MSAVRRECFAVCAPGLEPFVAAELAALRIPAGSPGKGGVPFRATPRQLYAANAWLRTATRVLVRLGRFRATDFATYERRVRELDWQGVIDPSIALVVHASSSGSHLFHTGAIEERTRSAIARACGVDALRAVAPDTDEMAQLVTVRVRHDEITVSVDSSGDALHRRGWRLATARAPLRPTLAAAMLDSVGWDGTLPLVDPCCGSGTIVVEAAVRAAGIAPGARRSFAFQRWPDFEPGSWASVRAGLVPASPGETVRIVGADRDAGAIDATAANAERAGVGGTVDVRHSPLLRTLRDDALIGSVPGWIITNPPYGQRVRGGDLRDLYASLGAAVRGPLAGWRLAMLVADPVAARHCGLPLQEMLRTTSGGTTVTVLATEG